MQAGVVSFGEGNIDFKAKSNQKRKGVALHTHQWKSPPGWHCKSQHLCTKYKGTQEKKHYYSLNHILTPHTDSGRLQ